MAFFKRVLLIASILAVGAYAAPQGGNNEYLPPPNDGYDYPKPAVPFVSAAPQQISTVYRPPAQSSPTPRPPTTSYPRPQPQYNPSPQPPPSYKPPQNTYIPPPQNNPTYRPPQQNNPTYRPPQQNNPTYRPPQQNNPTYRPPVAPAYKPPQVQSTPVIYTPPKPVYGAPTPQPQRPYSPPATAFQDNGQDGSSSHDNHHGADHVHAPGMPYDFNYAVKDDYYGTDFSQNEVSDGDNVKGEYRVQLPDGRLQIVRYTADWKTGFHAEVTYEGEARFPEPAPYKPQQQQPNLQSQPSNQADSAGYNYPTPSKKPSTNYGPPQTGY